MSKFAKIEASKVKAGKTASYEIFGISGMEGATVIGRPATRRLNLPYTNAVMRATEKLNRQARATKDKAGILNAQSDAARDPFGRFVLTGWDNIKGSDGKLVPYTPQDGADFISALPDYIFDELVVYFSTEANFVDEAGQVDTTEDEAKDTAKN